MISEKFVHVFYELGILTECAPEAAGLEITALSCDSRKVKKGTLFFVKGVGFKPEFLDAARESGAVAYVAEQNFHIQLPYIGVSDVRSSMPAAADLFYGHPSGEYLTVGVTGTKGKTTVACMIKSIFDIEFSEKTGLISTNGAWSGSEALEKSGGSTPEALEFYSLMDEFHRRGAKAVCAEISSQALRYNRVTGTDFFVGTFTNLSRDHISESEHHSFEDYKDAKKELFSMCRCGIFNIDDAYAQEFISSAACKKKITVGINKNADIRADDIIITRGGASFRVRGIAYDGELFEIRIPGEFNIYNALCAIAAAYVCGCGVQSVKEGLLSARVEGRMEIYTESGITVISDYAHNEVSFEVVFEYIKRFYPESRIICLFGCQGNKALGRRSELPAIVGKYADYAVITTDDPENEDPRMIMNEVENELKKTNVPYVMIEDREKAVRYAVENANKGDVVFLAGKGRETTQKVHGKTIYYKGDMPSAEEALSAKK